MRKKILALGLCACILGVTGCDKPAPVSQKTTANIKTTQAVEVTQEASTALQNEETTSGVEDTLPEETEWQTKVPVTEAPTETTDPLQSTRDISEYQKHVEFSIFDFVYHYDNPEENFSASLLVPQVYTKNKKLYKQINDNIVNHSEGGFRGTLELRNLEITSYYEVMTENDELLSYFMTRRLHHLDADQGQYREFDENKSAVTMERRTGKVYTLADVYGMDQVVKDITEGKYQVIAGSEEVFRRFTDEQLASLYSKNTTVAKDDDHKYDFYIQDGHVCVLIWVGPNFGNYVRLKLGESILGK